MVNGALHGARSTGHLVVPMNFLLVLMVLLVLILIYLTRHGGYGPERATWAGDLDRLVLTPMAKICDDVPSIVSNVDPGREQCEHS